MKNLKVLSLFDGMSGGQQALKDLGLELEGVITIEGN